MSDLGFVWSVLPEWYNNALGFCKGDKVSIKADGKEHSYIITRVDIDGTVYCEVND